MPCWARIVARSPGVIVSHSAPARHVRGDGQVPPPDVGAVVVEPAHGECAAFPSAEPVPNVHGDLPAGGVRAAQQRADVLGASSSWSAGSGSGRRLPGGASGSSACTAETTVDGIDLRQPQRSGGVRPGPGSWRSSTARLHRAAITRTGAGPVDAVSHTEPSHSAGRATSGKARASRWSSDSPSNAPISRSSWRIRLSSTACSTSVRPKTGTCKGNGESPRLSVSQR